MEKQAKTCRICFIVSMLTLWGILSFTLCGRADTLLYEDFEDGTPLSESEWTVSGEWNVQNIANYTEGSGYCVENPGMSITSLDTLQLPATDFSDYSSVYLYFSTYFEQLQESKTISTEVSTDGGSSWLSTGWEQSGIFYMGEEAVDLSDWLAGVSTGAVRFVYADSDGEPDSGSIWQIDDVRLEAEPSPGNTISGIVWDGIQGIQGAVVEAYNWENPEGMDYFFTETDASGNYSLNVYDGDWEVGIILPNPTWVTPQPQTVTVGGAIFSQLADFTVGKSPDGFVSGQILSPAGTPLTGTESPNYGVYIDAVNVENGFWYCANPDAQGNYSIPLMSGIYEISVWIDPETYPDYTAPFIDEPVSLTSGTVPLNITLLSENCKISGTVRKDATGIPGVFVDVWNEYGEWRYAVTAPNGYFEVPVYPGTWYVSPWTWGTDAVLFTGPPQEKTVASGQTATADFNMSPASQPITGVIKDESGTVLTVIDAWVYAREENSPNPIAETWVENGEFRINVPPGNYKVGLYLSPDSEYRFDPLSDEQSVTQARSKRIAEISTTAGAAILELSGQEKSSAASSGKDRRSGEPLVFILKSNTKKIQGNFRDSDGTAITRISGYVFADRVLQTGETAVNSLSWHLAEINSETGGFEIPVSAGTWALSYSLFSVPEVFPYRELTEPIFVTVAETDQTTTQNIVLPPLGSGQLCGTVYYPDGAAPAPNILVWLRSTELDITDGNFMEYQTRSDETGKFCFSLPDNLPEQSMDVGTAVKPMDWESPGRASRRANGGSSQTVSWPIRKRSNDLILTLREPNVQIGGTVFRPGGTETAAGAFVYAYSADGQKTDATAAANGTFTLEAARAESSRGNIWRVGAISKNPDGTYSRTKEILCSTSDSAQSVFAVGNMVLDSGKTMMGSANHTFLPEKGWSHTLADGTGIQIPDGAIPVGRDVQQVKISVEPLVRDLPNTAEDRVVGYGYGITLRGKEDGREIVKKFSKNATVILRYTDELLSELGIREADLRPAYFLTASRSWKPLKNFTVDTVANKVTFRTDHFSTWALVAKNGFPEPGNVNGSRETGGGVTLADAIVSLQICAGAAVPEGVQIFREAAVNGDLKIGQEEAVYILQKVANLR